MLGDVHLWSVLLLLLAVIAAAVLILAKVPAIGIKLLIVFGPIVWMLGKALRVTLDPP